ncbi:MULTISPECIES: lytic murein transglycosylase [unclassified Marinovum]
MFRGFPVRVFLCLLVFALFSVAAQAQDKSAVERQFQSWLQSDIWPRARAKSVSRQTFEAAFGGITLDWDLPDLVPPGAAKTTPKRQRQAEFGAPSKYFSGNSVGGAARVGKQMATRHAKALAETERRTGVPGHIVLAIWGRESGYGQVPIRHNVFRVLGTKGFMSTRADYFADELVAALQIAEAGHAPEAAMKSSWAGALGQPQFMPSNFLEYAVDGNGDRKADIWRSEADTIASIGNYLGRHGWVAGRDWGFEVRVPKDVSCTLEGPDQGRPIADWAKMGLTRVNGKPFPANELQDEGYLMMPAGRLGPAFVVTPNFYVLKDYNTSDLYALFVGHVGDKIAYNVPDFRASWGTIDKLYRSDIAAAQRTLEKLGHDVGGADGLPGFKTRRSIGRWQESKGQAATCFPDKRNVAALGG